MPDSRQHLFTALGWLNTRGIIDDRHEIHRVNDAVEFNDTLTDYYVARKDASLAARHGTFHAQDSGVRGGRTV
jgi:hypothetical protein